MPWIESLGAAAMAVLAFFLGRWFSKLPNRYWLIGYLAPLAVILLYTLALYQPRLGLVPPLSWMMIGRHRFVCFNFAAILLLSAPLVRLTHKRTRTVICVLIIVLSSVSIVPFMAPALNRSYLAGLATRLDPNGVCRQSNDYTCGPAAAVTALRKLGLPAEEGEIALLAHTSFLTGTEPDVLAKELQKRYAADGLRVEYRAFHDITELAKAGLTIAVVKFNALQDHCVTVLGVETNGVLVADPLSGLSLVSGPEFERKWLSVGIVLKRVNLGTN